MELVTGLFLLALAGISAPIAFLYGPVTAYSWIATVALGHIYLAIKRQRRRKYVYRDIFH